MFFTILAGLVGVLGYFLLLELWLVPILFRMKWSERWKWVGVGTLVGIFLMATSTNVWRPSRNYITFLLPPQKLEISVPDQEELRDTRLLWFTTAVGDISYDSITYRGWRRNNDQLALANPSKAHLEWSGRTGDQASILFHTGPGAGTVSIFWNGAREDIDLASRPAGKYLYSHQFAVPFYASPTITKSLLLLQFILISCAFALLFYEKREFLLGQLKGSISSFPFYAVDQVAESSNKQRWMNNVILDTIACVTIMCLAILLRVFNLENLYPYTDEYNHLLAAKEIIQGVSIASVYPRSLFIVTLPVALSLRVFGVHLWSARLPGVFFNVLAVVPLYLLGRKINRPVAVISALLYATNPWIIAISRNVREYAYYPFYFYWILLGMVEFIRLVPDRFVLLRDRWILVRSRLGLLGFALLLPIVYSILDQLFVRPSSTFKIILIAYGMFGLFVMRKFDFRNRSNRLAVAIIGLIAFAGGGLFYGANSENVSLTPEFNGYFVRYFLTNPQQQWYFDRSILLPMVMLVIAVVVGSAMFRHNFIAAFVAGLGLASVLFFAFFFARYFRLRYIFSLELWYTLLLAIGVYALSLLIKLLFRGRMWVSVLSVSAMFALFLNPHQIVLSEYYDSQGYMPITEEYHDDVGPVYQFLTGKVRSNDVLLSTIYGSFVAWKGGPAFRASYYYRYTDDNPKSRIYSIVKGNPSGWIVLDDRRFMASDPLPLDSMEVVNKQIEYIGAFDDQYVWHWQDVSPSP